MAAPRRAWVTIEYDGKDITEQVSAALLSFTYTDKSAGEADELDITMHDREGHWITDWYPKVRVKGSDGSSVSGADSGGDNEYWDDAFADILWSDE